MSPSEERVARNETLFREFNERVEGLGGDSPRIAFVCECGDLGCLERLELTRTSYEQVRSDPRRFVVAPGHENPDVERVVARLHDYLVVEKVAEAARIAVEHDPRA